jgi:hypothetical protein
MTTLYKNKPIEDKKSRVNPGFDVIKYLLKKLVNYRIHRSTSYFITFSSWARLALISASVTS